MSHARFAELLLEHAYGELSPREAREVEAHAASCEECRAELARLRATRRIMGALPEERAPEAGERILLAAAREAARERAPARILPRWFWSASAVAALFLAVGAVSYRLLAMRPAEERPGEELLGHGSYAEAPPAPAAPTSVEPGATSDRAVPAETPAPARPAPRRAEPAAPAKSRIRSLARDEEVRAAPAPAPTAEAPAEARAAAPARRAEASKADDAEAAGFAAPPEPSREEVAPLAAQAPRSRSAGAPAASAAAAPAPAGAPEPRAERKAADAGPRVARPDAAVERYASLRAAGALSGEVRTFPGCDGESWRKVERDAQGRTVKYVREGRVAGRRLRVEHVFGADGALASVRVSDLARGTPVDAAALGLTIPRDASEATADAPPRCGR